jgi:hypothetical protein
VFILLVIVDIKNSFLYKMSVTFEVTDGTITIPRYVVESHPFFSNHTEYERVDKYIFPITVEEFCLVLSHITNKVLPVLKKRSNEFLKVVDFLMLRELYEFSITDDEYFLENIVKEDLDILDSKELIKYENCKNDENYQSCYIRINHPLKNYFLDVDLFFGRYGGNFDLIHMNWDSFIYTVEYPVEFFSIRKFYMIGKDDLANFQKNIERLDISVVEQEDFISFEIYKKTYRVYRKVYSDIWDFLESRNDCDAYYYGKNNDQVGLWLTERFIRFQSLSYNLYDPRYKRVMGKIPLEFVGTFERNAHLIKDFLL